MTEMIFSKDSLLMSGTPEQRVVISLSMLDASAVRNQLEELLESYLNWPWIIMQAMHHRTISLQWETLKKLDLVSAAIKSGLPKNWIAYSEQISRASLKRNSLWLDRLEWVFEEFNKAGIPTVCIKGGALIGDIYHQGNRMLGDIDSLALKSDSKDIKELLFELGFKQGIIDPITSTIKPMSREKMLFWSMNAHIMPKFTLELNDPDCPFLRFAVGFDFFDPDDRHSYPSEKVIENRALKSSKSHVYVADDSDTLINLCAHIFREGTSATMGFAGDNWNLWKFCDFRSKLAQFDPHTISPILRPRLEEANLKKPFYYALYFLEMVYGDNSLKRWFDLCNPGEDLDFLFELFDGDRRVRYDRPFVDQLFDPRRVVVPGLEPIWSKVMGDGEWW